MILGLRFIYVSWWNKRRIKIKSHMRCKSCSCNFIRTCLSHGIFKKGVIYFVPSDNRERNQLYTFFSQKKVFVTFRNTIIKISNKTYSMTLLIVLMKNIFLLWNVWYFYLIFQNVSIPFNTELCRNIAGC